MKTKEDYDELMRKGHLSKIGFMHYIAILKGEILDLSEQIKRISKTHVFNGDIPLKEANKRKKQPFKSKKVEEAFNKYQEARRAF